MAGAVECIILSVNDTYMDAQEVMHMTDYSKITALYSRLSVGDEDRDGGESNSMKGALNWAALTYGNISWIACSLISAWSFRMFFSLRIASRTISSLVNRMPLMKKLSEQQRVRVAMILSWHCQTVMILSLARVVLLYLAAKSNVFRLRGLS